MPKTFPGITVIGVFLPHASFDISSVEGNIVYMTGKRFALEITLAEGKQVIID